LGDFVSAEVEYSKALETGTNLAIAYRNLGLTKIKLGKNKDALAFLTEYMETAPDDFAIEKAVADLYIGSGDFASAIQHLEKVLRNNPADIDSLFAISECYHSMGYIQSAQIGYSQILKINPGHRKAKERMAQLGASLKTV